MRYASFNSPILGGIFKVKMTRINDSRVADSKYFWYVESSSEFFKSLLSYSVI